MAAATPPDSHRHLPARRRTRHSIRFAVPLAPHRLHHRRLARLRSGRKVVVTGYPVRPDIRAGPAVDQRASLGSLRSCPRPARSFVLAAAGARALSTAPSWPSCPQLLADIQVIHVSGTLTTPEVEITATLPAGLRAYYRPTYLHDDMARHSGRPISSLWHAPSQYAGRVPGVRLAVDPYR